MDSTIVTADCNCPPAKKGNLCKHVWAALLKTEKDHADFLYGKSEINAVGSVSLSVKMVANKSNFASPSQELYKVKQADYRKLQYQKQKIRAQEFKKLKKAKGDLSINQPPRDVQDALYFFANNGFDFQLPLDAKIIGIAKKKLSRFFHPDAGGTHNEILKLNANFETLIRFIKAKATCPNTPS